MRNAIGVLVLVLVLGLATACGVGTDQGAGGRGNSGNGGGGILTGGVGGTGGGGVTTPSGPICAKASDCSAFTCSCPDGKLWNSAQYCLNRACQNRIATCANACKDNGGSTGGGGAAGGGGTGSAATVYGCALSKYSTEFSVTMEVYGSNTARERLVLQQRNSHLQPRLNRSPLA